MPSILMESWKDELFENQNLEENKNAGNTDVILE